MQISLSRAHRLVKAINAKTLNPFKGLTISIHSDLAHRLISDGLSIENEKAIADEASVVSSTFLNDVKSIRTLTEIAFHLREKIDAVNHENSISAMLNRKALLSKLNATYRLVSNTIQLSVVNRSTELDKLRGLSANFKKDSSGLASEDIALGVFGESDLKNAQDSILKNQREIREIDDNLARSNASLTIDIADKDVSFVNDAGIIW